MWSVVADVEIKKCFNGWDYVVMWKMEECGALLNLLP